MIWFYSTPQNGQTISTDVRLTLYRLDPDLDWPQLIPSLLEEEQHVIFAKAEGAHFHIPRDSNRLTDEQVP